MTQRFAEWHWVTAPGGPLHTVGCLTFVRGATPGQVIEAFDMDPTEAVLMTEADARRELDIAGFDDYPWVRAGRVGEWAFAIEDMQLNSFLEGVGAGLSAGTETVLAHYVDAKALGGVEYLVNGVTVSAFEPLRAWDRSGTEPDRFLPHLRGAGLAVDAGAGTDGDLDPMLAALGALTPALGISLPEDVARGPLLTAQREPDTGWLGL